MRYASLFLVIFVITINAAQRESSSKPRSLSEHIKQVSSFSIPEFRACFEKRDSSRGVSFFHPAWQAPQDGSCPAQKLPLGLWQKIALEMTDKGTSVEHTLADVASLTAVDRGLSKLLVKPIFFNDDQDADWAQNRTKLKGVSFAHELVQKLHAAHKRSSISIADEILYRESVRPVQKKRAAYNSMVLRISMRALTARLLIGFDHYTALTDGGVLVTANVAPLFADDGRLIDTGGVQLARINTTDALDRTFDLSKKAGEFARLSVFKPIGINLIKPSSIEDSGQPEVIRINPTLQRYLCGDHQEFTFTHQVHLREGDTVCIYDFLDVPPVQPRAPYDPEKKLKILKDESQYDPDRKCQTLKDAMAKMYITNRDNGNDVKIDRIQKNEITIRCDFPDYFS